MALRARWAGGLHAALRKRSIELVARVRRAVFFTACGGAVVARGRAAMKVGDTVKGVLLGER